MKVAIVSSIPAFPATSGNRRRIQRLVEAISGLGHEIVFVYLPIRPQLIDRAAHNNAFGSGNFFEIRNDGRFGTLRQYLRSRVPSVAKNLFHLVGGCGFYYTGLDSSYNPRWTAQIANATAGVDTAIVEYVFNSRAFEAFPAHVLRLLDTHDSFSDRHKLYRGHGLRNGYWISLTPEAECLGFRRADIVMAIQDDEAELFRSRLAKEGTGIDGGNRSFGNPSVAVVSHLVDLTQPIEDYSTSETAIFVASDTPANRQAVDVLVRHILPRVLERSGRFNLVVAGSICNVVPNDRHVTKLGTVENLASAYAAAPLSLNPILSGTGIAIKLLDAMAAGVPSISTETGARGLPAGFRNGVVCVRNGDYEAFADTVARMACDSEARARLGAAAFADAKRWNDIQLGELRRCLTAAV